MKLSDFRESRSGDLVDVLVLVIVIEKAGKARLMSNYLVHIRGAFDYDYDYDYDRVLHLLPVAVRQGAGQVLN